MDIHFEDKETFTEKNQKYKTIDLDLKIFGGKKVLSLNHSLLEIKIASCKCLKQMMKKFYGRVDENKL